MNKPNFPKDGGRIAWTKVRIRYVRHCAETQEMTAREIAADIGLEDGQEHRIFAICTREKIDLKGTGPKRQRREMSAPIAANRMPVLRDLSKKLGKSPKAIAAMILDAALSEGVGYCNNLLDLEA